MTVDTDTEPVYPAWSFGDRIRKARTITGMTQGDFADEIGVKEGSLAAWETDRALPRDIVAIAKRVEMITRIPAGWLLGIEAAGPPNPPYRESLSSQGRSRSKSNNRTNEPVGQWVPSNLPAVA